MLHTVIFIGRSGCGKGTQARLLTDRINRLDEEHRQIMYVETGEKFREFFRNSDYSAEIAKKIYHKDDRQPDFLACWMWSGMLIS